MNGNQSIQSVAIKHDIRNNVELIEHKITPTLGLSISGTKCDRDKPILRGPIGLKIPKIGVITAEPTYHAKVWEYPPPCVIN